MKMHDITDMQDIFYYCKKHHKNVYTKIIDFIEDKYGYIVDSDYEDFIQYELNTNIKKIDMIYFAILNDFFINNGVCIRINNIKYYGSHSFTIIKDDDCKGEVYYDYDSYHINMEGYYKCQLMALYQLFK